MPRPKRTTVASSAAKRVAKPTQDTAIAPQPATTTRRNQRNSKARKQDENNAVKDMNDDHRNGGQSSEETMQPAKPEPLKAAASVRTRGRPRTMVKKIQPDVAQTKIIEGLRQKMNAPSTAPHASADEATTTAVHPAPREPRKRLKSSSTLEQRSPVAENTAGESDTQPERPRTPSADKSDDLYGLSPTGKATQERTQQKTKAQPQSVQRNVPQSSLKAQGTPAVENSILALQKFKRRPRQPSILRMVQLQSDMLDDSLDEFDPDDESTPLSLGKLDDFAMNGLSPSSDQAAEPRTSSSRKRKRSQPQESDVQVLRSSPPVAHEASPRHSPDLPSDSSSLPEVVADTQEDRADLDDFAEPEIFSETMAPPRSSSPIGEEDEDQHPRGSRQKTRHALEPVRDHQANPTRSSRQRNQKETKLSTAALRALLPRRKWRKDTGRLDPFQIPSSDTGMDTTSLDDDEDELQYGHQKRTSHKTPGAKRPHKKSTKGNPKSKKSLIVEKPVVRTYSRRASDKENWAEQSEASASEEDDITEEGRQAQVKTVDVKHSKELAAAVRKFQEIDEWQMDYESVELGASGSSPWR